MPFNIEQHRIRLTNDFTISLKIYNHDNIQWPNGPKCLMMQHWKKAAAQQWLGDGGGDAICRNFPLAPLIICRPLHKADKFHTKGYLATC